MHACMHANREKFAEGTFATMATTTADVAPPVVPPAVPPPAEPHEVEDRIYDSIELEEMDYVEEDGMYYYQCPCGDMFEISEVCARAPPPLS